MIKNFKDAQRGEIKEEAKRMILKNYQKLEVDALYNLGSCFFVKGKFDNDYYKNSIEWLKKAIEYSIKIGYPILEGKCYNMIGLIHLQNKEYNKAEDFLKKDEEITEREKDVFGQVQTLKSLALVYNGKKDYEKALNALKKAARRSEAFGRDDEINSLIETVLDSKKLFNEVI